MKKLKDLYIAYTLRKQINFIVSLYNAGFDKEVELYLELLSFDRKTSRLVKMLLKF